MPLDNHVISAIRQACDACPGPVRVWLFGSRARGDAGREADIDLAVEAQGLTRKDWLRLWSHLTYDLPVLAAVDVVRLESAPDRLRQSIRAEGVLLHDTTRTAA